MNAAFMHIVKDFDTLNRKGLPRDVTCRHAHRRVVRAGNSCHDGSTTSVRVNGVMSK